MFYNGEVDYAELKIQVGETLQLQTRDGEDSRRLQVKLVGYMPGASLLVTTPTVGGKTMIMREGQPFVVRMLSGKRIVGFTTTILRSCARPFPYLHLAYPQEVEQITVRQAERVRVKLFASLSNPNPEFPSAKPRSATIVDISTSGALMVAAEQLGAVGDAVTVRCALKIGGKEKLLSLPALIRSIYSGQNEEYGGGCYYHGLEFAATDEQDVFALHGFVYEQIVRAHSE